MTANIGSSYWLSSNPSPPGRMPPEEPGQVPKTFLNRPILIIEDEAMIAWSLADILEDMGFRSVAVTSRGEDAVVNAAISLPTLIISDINLGPRGMDGIDAAIAIRRICKADVIFITGYAGSESTDRIDAALPGALVLRKPIIARQLQRAIVELANAKPPN